MMKRGLVFLLAVLLACVLGGCSGGGSQAASSSSSAGSGQDDPTAKACEVLRANDIGAGAGYEWIAFDLARAGDNVSQPPLSEFAESMAAYTAQKNGVLDERTSTEYSKAVLALGALGVNARDVSGHDLTAPLTDGAFVSLQGVNGPIWALIALSSNPAYAEVPELQQAIGMLVDTVVQAQGEDGGWSFTGQPGDESDADLTAMALTALAPYRDDAAHPQAATAVEAGLAWLEAAQQPDGGFAYKGQESCETAAQVAIALCSLGIDPETDSRFAKQDGSVLSNLEAFQDATGAFAHAKGDDGTLAPDPYATEQGARALIAVQRLRAGKSALYDLSDAQA